MKYKIGDVVQCVDEELMFTRQVTLVPFYNKIDKTEYVEFNGKQYDKKKLEEALQLLTEKERKVILLYYYEELTLKEISNVMDVSESRISQLHTRALQKMKQKIGKYMGILTDRE